MSTYHQGRQDRDEAQRLLNRRTKWQPSPSTVPADVEQFMEAARPYDSAFIMGEITNERRWQLLHQLAVNLGVLARVDWRLYVRADGVLPAWAAEATKGKNL